MGPKFLNVEDAEELEEMKSVLIFSGIAMIMWGAAILLFSLAEPLGVVPTDLAAIGGGLLFIVGTMFATLSYRRSDELMTAVNLEASAITYGLSVFFLGGWGVLAHLEYMLGPQPLDLITSFYILVLVGTFAAAGRRGMLKPR